jgi:uncharacterized LabA/DUF88 family protein
MRVYVYVDGESHFVRSAALWQKLYGDGAELSQIISPDPGIGSCAYPDTEKPYPRIEARAKFFWDTRYSQWAPSPFHGHSVDGAVYFTTYSGDDDGYHGVCVYIRGQRFDPQVTKEPSDLSKRRKNQQAQQGLVEKAKGVDIGLSIRMLEDAYRDIYDWCYLFTSDIDFLPVIRAVQRIGKKVVVFGYKDGLSARSELEYVPDAFVDLSDYMRKHYQPKE